MSRVRVACRLLVAAAIMLLWTACSTIEVSPEEYRHMLCVDSDGQPAALEVIGVLGTKREHRTHVKEIAAAYQAWRRTSPNRRRVMIVIHGGLVSMAAAVEEARLALRAMAASPPTGEQDEFFPIFVNWETGLGSSWVDHMLFVRAGERNWLWATLTCPFVLVADIGAAIARYPLTLALQAQSMFEYYDGDIAEVPESWKSSVAMDPAADTRTWTDGVLDVGGEVFLGILRPASGLLLDAAGTPAYRNMRRRGRVLFVCDSDYGTETGTPQGGMSLLMEQLLVEARKNDEVIPVSIVAHSMGTGVANDLIHRFGWRERVRSGNRGAVHKPAFEIDEIVYMGAACTIREFTHTVLPYIRAADNREFFNLCLHPLDEMDDRYALGAAPHGSLLEWIDDFITPQETQLDRTLGKWNNIVRALLVMGYLPGDVRRRIHVRGFARGADTPQDHGDFNDARQKFWLREFWQPRLGQRP